MQENLLNKDRVFQIAIAMNTNSANTENFFWCQQLDIRQTRILEGGQPFVDFDAADDCCLYIMTIKANNFQDDSRSTPFHNFNDYYVLVFDLTSMQDTTKYCQ